MNNISKMPDAYCKKNGSNNERLLSLFESEISDFRNNITDIYNAVGIESAVGIELDMIGSRLNQSRGKLDDNAYRILLKAKIGCDMCPGTFDGVLKCINSIFGGVTEDIVLEEKPGAVNLRSIPLAAITESCMTGDQAYQIIKKLMPVGIEFVGVADGTFSFASGDETETDKDMGFSDDDGQTGGYFGMILADSASAKLPI